LFWIGLAMAAALNANTVTIVKQVSTSDTVRQALVEEAKKAQPIAQNPSSTTTSTTASDSLSTDRSEGESGRNKPPAPSSYQKLANDLSKVKSLGLPLGWGNEERLSFRQGGWNYLYYPFGWLLTAIAVSLGAPFWFDLLNKFMVVRSTVKPQEESPPEGSKDKQP